MEHSTLLTLKKYTIVTLAAVWLYLAPIRPALVCVMALPAIDLGLALLVAIRAAKPTSFLSALRIIESKGLGETISKVLRYTLGTVLCYTVDKNLMFDNPLALKALLALIGARELKSCLEHLDDLGANPVFAQVLTKLDPSSKDQTKDQ